jgi:hypothetical protein
VITVHIRLKRTVEHAQGKAGRQNSENPVKVFDSAESFFQDVLRGLKLPFPQSVD